MVLRRHLKLRDKKGRLIEPRHCARRLHGWPCTSHEPPGGAAIKLHSAWRKRQTVGATARDACGGSACPVAGGQSHPFIRARTLEEESGFKVSPGSKALLPAPPASASLRSIQSTGVPPSSFIKAAF